jgi:hypothetical protein
MVLLSKHEKIWAVGPAITDVCERLKVSRGATPEEVNPSPILK